MRIYLAGPMTTGDFEGNQREALKVAGILMRAGFNPFIPHQYQLLNLVCPQAYERFLELDFDFIEGCAAIFRFFPERPSSGAAREAEFAAKIGKPVFTSLLELMKWRDELQTKV